MLWNQTGQVSVQKETIKVFHVFFLCVSQLRACLGMQILACAACIVNMVCTLIKIEDEPLNCWQYHYDNDTLHYGETCYQIRVSYNCVLFRRFS